MPPERDIDSTSRIEGVYPTRRSRASRGHAVNQGQSLVEFALLLPVLIFIFAGAADLGRALTAYIELGSAAREGAAYGSQNHDTVDETGLMADAARAAAPDIWGQTPNVSAVGCNVMDGCPGDAQEYSYAEVTVSYTFDPVMPVVPGFTMERTARMRVLN